MTTKVVRLTERQRRSVTCPTCSRGRGRPCVSSRQPSANSFGGGWGGPSDLDREHAERVAFARRRVAARAEAVAALCECDDVDCWACGPRKRGEA